MHPKPNIHSQPENALYINDLSLASVATDSPYETQSEYDTALTGQRKSEGGVLPDDNVRVYVSLDLSANSILYQLDALVQMLGTPDYENESFYALEVGKIISQLEIYDQVWAEREHRDKTPDMPEVIPGHSRLGVELARKVVEVLEENEGSGDSFRRD